MLDRDTIFERAYLECMTEMYEKAQPKANFIELRQKVKDGLMEDSPENPIYNRHYLSHEEFIYILNKYTDAYRFTAHFKDNMDVVRDYFTGKGMKDIWVKEGESGYRSCAQVPHIKNTFSKILNENGITDTKLANKLSNEVLQYIENCKNFYNFDYKETSFQSSIALGCSPTSNPQTVIEYWKQQGVDITINERNPNLLWDMDYYGDDFEEVMVDEYGEDWEKVTWDDYYNSPEGKKKIVADYLYNHSEFDNYYIRGSEKNLYIAKFCDSNVKIPIDDFIRDHEICGGYGIISPKES
ncbi:MAG: hypothetical protein IKU29_11795 [Parabacteroides sp.]|nr:hypothetical protein [Parabacteroides sp.]